MKIVRLCSLGSLDRNSMPLSEIRVHRMKLSSSRFVRGDSFSMPALVKALQSIKVSFFRLFIHAMYPIPCKEHIIMLSVELQGWSRTNNICVTSL